MYCKKCDREVGVHRKFNWIAFLLWSLIGGVGGICIYLPWYVLFGSKRCPICRSRV